MRRLLALLVLSITSEAGAAVVLDRQVDLSINGNSVIETVRLLVELGQQSDLLEWDRFPIFLNENVELDTCKAAVLDSDGRVLRKIPRKRFHRLDASDSEIQTSSWRIEIPFDELEVGERIKIDYTLRRQHYFPAQTLRLEWPVPQKRLAIRVEGGGEQFRWRIDRVADSVQVREKPGGLELEAHDIAKYVAPAHAPAGLVAAQSLQIGWGRTTSWKDVGVWYDGQMANVAREDPTVTSLARSLVDGVDSPRERVRILADHVRSTVRYEAVEIGVGGYVPTPAAQVSQRAWGDCKDKAELLSEMLAAVDIPSHPVLLFLGLERSIDLEFPSLQFNHAILAVPSEAAGVGPTDTVADGFLFIDPTSPSGTLEWLAPETLGRSVLVVDGDRSRMVRIPDNPEADSRSLEIDAEVADSGDLEGRARMTLFGSVASGILNEVPGTEIVRRMIEPVGPGLQLFDLAWEESSDCSAPCVGLKTGISRTHAVRGRLGRRVVRAEGQDLFPEPRILEGRTIPVALRAGTRHTRWRIELPRDWCPPEPSEDRVENDLGHVSTLVSGGDNVITVVREARLNHSWVRPDQIGQLRELAVAETRAERRQIRLRCPE